MSGISPKGFLDESQYRGKMPVVADFKLQKAAAVVAGNIAYTPCEVTVVALILKVQTVLTDTGAAFSFGEDQDADAYLDSWVIKDVAAGVYDLASQVAVTGAAGGWITKTVPANRCVYASLDNVSGTTGLCYGRVVMMPT